MTERASLTRRDRTATLQPIVREQAHVLGNLFELYAHDFSEYVRLVMRENGRFEVPFGGERWWNDEGHHPFFIRTDGELCGFALVARGSRVTDDRDVMDVTQFFVVRGARRQGVGQRAAHAVFALFPGRWEVRVRCDNAPALRFWTRVVEQWLGRAPTRSRYAGDDAEWELLRF